MTTPGWSAPPPNAKVCDLCFHVSPDVSRALVRTIDGRYEVVDRCRDHAACAERRRTQ